MDDPQGLFDQNTCYPRILLAMTGSFVGFDCAEVYYVVRIGFPTSAIDMVQEMGRCRQGRNNSDGVVTDEFHRILSLPDFIYLNEKLYKSTSEKVKDIATSIRSAMVISDVATSTRSGTSTRVRSLNPNKHGILTPLQEIDMQHKSLIRLLRIILIKGVC